MLAIATLVFSLTACQPVAYLMSTPLVMQVGTVDASAAASDSRDRMTLFYTTTRQPQGSPSSRSYGEDFAEELRLGVATLRVDEGAAIARETRALPPLSQLQERPPLELENLNEQAVIGTGADLDVLSPEAATFFAEVDDALAASTDKDVFVYVHGGNNSVYRTAAQAAQYRRFTGRGSVVVAFAWPTVDNYLSYASDVRNAERSVPAFGRLLELLGKHTKVEHINVMAHSAGVRIVSAALASIGSEPANREVLRQRLRLGEVYYAAADLELKTLVRDLRDYVDLPMRITLQSNRGDVVLAFLALRSGKSRVGRPNFNDLNDAERALLREWVTASRIDIVDVTSDRASGPGGHVFWFERRWVGSDVLLEFTYHAPPTARGLQATDRDGLRQWIFPADYEERASTTAGKLHLR